MPGYVQVGDEVRCFNCRAWDAVVSMGATCFYGCGSVMTQVGKTGDPYLAIMERRR